jgi:hypothetical protein
MTLALLLLVVGCREVCPFDAVALPDAPVTTEAGLVALLDATREATFPELGAADIGVRPLADLKFLRAWIELDSVAEEDGFARRYTIEYDPVLLADPPEPAALAAVLVHELGHVDDYVGMTSEEVLEFAVWYGTADPMTSDELSAYERGTDEKALVRGCADGLSAMRSWIYAHSDEAVRAEKERNYYTPAEIDAWVAANGRCP